MLSSYWIESSYIATTRRRKIVKEERAAQNMTHDGSNEKLVLVTSFFNTSCPQRFTGCIFEPEASRILSR